MSQNKLTKHRDRVLIRAIGESDDIVYFIIPAWSRFFAVGVERDKIPFDDVKIGNRFFLTDFPLGATNVDDAVLDGSWEIAPEPDEFDGFA